MFDIKGKICLVTGGATGIGLAYSKELLRNGAQGVMIGDVNTAKGQEAAAMLNKEFGNKVTFMKTDVTKKEELEALFKSCVNSFKGLDIVINNAGILNDQKWELQIAINCNAVVEGTLLGINYMSKDKGGKGGVIVNIASILGLQELAGCPVYVGSKHFVVGLTRSFGQPWHWTRTGIKFLTMCPGVTDTPLISEAGTKPLWTMSEIGKELDKELGALPAQPPENVAKGMMTLISKGDNGSVWVCEGNQPIYEVVIPNRLTLRKV